MARRGFHGIFDKVSNRLSKQIGVAVDREPAFDIDVEDYFFFLGERTIEIDHLGGEVENFDAAKPPTGAGPSRSRPSARER